MKNPIETAKAIYRHPQRLFFRFRKIPEDSVLLVGTPLHRNLGDHLIAESEKRMLERCHPGKVIEIPTEVFRENKEYLLQLSPKIPVYITGGGWMGSLWIEDELTLQNMLECFNRHKIVILPQTVYYETSDPTGAALLRRLCLVMKRCTDVTFCARDENSYEFAKENFPLRENQILLVPDMALFYKAGRKPVAGICLRSDREKALSDNEAEKLTAYLEERYILKPFSTMSEKRIPSWNRKRSIEKMISMIKDCDLIVTDRLHAMIYSVIAGTKCVAFDNRTGKVKGIYEKWLRNDPDILFLDKYDEASLDGFVKERN